MNLDAVPRVTSYNQMSSSPVCGSRLSCTVLPLLAFPRNPCSGPNIFTMFIPLLNNVSTKEVFFTIDVWFANTATDLPFNCGRYDPMRSAPGMIGPVSWQKAVMLILINNINKTVFFNFYSLN